MPLLLTPWEIVFEPRGVRQKASRLLYKLAPGKGGSVGAIRRGGGALATDAASMAKVLSQYWG